MTTPTEVIEERLQTLDKCKTSQDVAELMRSAGVKGKVNNCYRCAIAQYLSDGTMPVVVHYNAVSGEEIEERELPFSTVVFIGDFDSGLYPDLIASA